MKVDLDKQNAGLIWWAGTTHMDANLTIRGQLIQRKY